MAVKIESCFERFDESFSSEYQQQSTVQDAFYQTLKLSAQKAKKATASIAQFSVVLQCGFYSFLKIGRAVTVHCFFYSGRLLKCVLKEKKQ